MTDLTQKFAAYSNAQLLDILDHSNEYLPEAVEAAKNLLDSRQLSEQEMNIARAELDALTQEKEAKDLWAKELANTVKHQAASVLSKINPLQAEIPRADKSIRIISLIFAGLSLFQFYTQFDLIRFMLTDSEATWDLSLVSLFLPLLLVPVATILFFRRTKIGWTLLAIFLTYSILYSVGFLHLTLRMPIFIFPTLEDPFPQAAPTTHIISLLFFAGVLWTMCKKDLREIYTLDKGYILRTVILTAVTALGMYALLR